MITSLSERCFNYHQVIQQEVEIWRELDHEHILKFIGACPVAEKPFMVCEMKANGDVLTYLRKNPNASKRKIVSIILSHLNCRVADALPNSCTRHHWV